MAATGKQDDVVIIKKYANRRLYNTSTSSYVTLEDLCRMVQEDVEFRVYDARTGEDLTRTVLTQIIVEEEQKGHNLLPIGFLRQIIGMYQDNMRWMLPQYLDSMMSWYAQHQEKMKHQFESTPLSGVFPLENLDEMRKQNLAMFEQAMRMFSPFGAPGGTPGRGTAGGGASGGTPSERPAAAPERTESRGNGEPAPSDPSIDELREQLARMQRQINVLAGRSDEDETDKSRKGDGGKKG